MEVNTKIQIPRNSLIFAPMEGAVTPSYRQVILKHYPEWNFIFTDFLRLPTGSNLKKDQILKHIGKSIYTNRPFLNKTALQILATERTSNESAAKAIEDLKIPWLDLNFGCPSKHVNRHLGGAYLLDHPRKIKLIVAKIRSSYRGYLSAKIRIGVSKADNFEENIKTLEGEGIDSIIIHPRTRNEMYKGISNWDFITYASSKLSIPVIGNGDINQQDDITRMLQITNCDSVMIGRWALSRPWLANEYINKTKLDNKTEISRFYSLLIAQMNNDNADEKKLMVTIKNLSHYLLKNEGKTREKLVRCQNLEKMTRLLQLPEDSENIS